jgi:hypothetical protein
MYNMPPPPWFYPQQPQAGGMDSWEKAFKFYEKLERKKLKKEEEDKKKDKKPSGGDGMNPFQMFILLTAITPFVGPASVWATSFMMRQAFENLQAIVPH